MQQGNKEGKLLSAKNICLGENYALVKVSCFVPSVVALYKLGLRSEIECSNCSEGDVSARLCQQIQQQLPNNSSVCTIKTASTTFLRLYLNVPKIVSPLHWERCRLNWLPTEAARLSGFCSLALRVVAFTVRSMLGNPVCIEEKAKQSLWFMSVTHLIHLL